MNEKKDKQVNKVAKESEEKMIDKKQENNDSNKEISHDIILEDENKAINEKNDNTNNYREEEYNETVKETIIESELDSKDIQKEKINKQQIEENSTKSKEKTSKKKLLSISIIIVVVILLLIFSVVFSLLNINNEKILNNIAVMGIDVGNMSKEEAIEQINEVIENKLSEELTLKKDDYETTINAKQINAQFDIETAVNEAYNIGRNGNIVTNNYNIIYNMIFGNYVECNMNYDEELLNKKITNISSKLPNAVVQSNYYIEDDDLIIVKGTKGNSIKEDELKNIILNQMKNISQKYSIVNIPTEEVEPEAIDLEKIKNEIYKEPKDAYVSKNPTTVHAEVNGVDFAISMEEAKKILEKESEEYIIPLKITVPDKTIEDLGEEAFPDELGNYSTRYDPSNYNRSNNIEISTEKIDGTIIMPGETFSYNQTVGERTIAAGYKEAGAYAGGKVVQDVGGGICQTSSTLYNAVLLANLEIVDRSNHQFLTSYVSAGRDATVSWGSIDFKFKNNREYPIKIEAKSKNGVCEMSIYGIKEETEYEVVIQSNVISYIPYTTKYEKDSNLEEGKEVVEQSGYNGCTSEAYRILKLNGEVVSKTLLSKDTYDPMTKIIRIGTKKTEDTKETSKSTSKNEKKENTDTKEETHKNNKNEEVTVNKVEE